MKTWLKARLAWVKAQLGKLHIHVPKWLAAWAASISASVVETIGQAVTTPGYDPLSLVAWKTLVLLSVKTVVIKTVLWLLGLVKKPTPPTTAGT